MRSDESVDDVDMNMNLNATLDVDLVENIALATCRLLGGSRAGLFRRSKTVNDNVQGGVRVRVQVKVDVI
jgi:hypothetical protein